MRNHRRLCGSGNLERMSSEEQERYFQRSEPVSRGAMTSVLRDKETEGCGCLFRKVFVRNGQRDLENQGK